MQISPVKTRVFLEHESLINFIKQHVARIPEKSVLVITSKIVALSEGRTAIYIDKKSKERLIRAESEWSMKTKYVWATLKDGALVASAGIDESNADGKLVLLPKNSQVAAQKIRKEVMKRYSLKQLGVIVTDSRVVPLRSGVLGIALGYAGFKGLRDYRGKKDIFGRKLKFSQTNVADGLATAAVLVMGEGDERFPIALITKAPVEYTNKIKRNELKIPINKDMYGPLFKSFPKKRLI